MDRDYFIDAINAVQGNETDRLKALKFAYWSILPGREVIYRSPPFDGVSFVVHNDVENSYDVITVDVNPETGDMIPNTAIVNESFMDERSAHEFLYKEYYGVYTYCEKGKYSEHYQDFLRRKHFTYEEI